MERSGRCMCGAVKYTAKLANHVSACHCGMCRQWTGGPLLAAATESVSFEDETHVRVFTSSTWAERGFCDVCGSSLFYRITAPGQYQGMTTVTVGTLDDQSGLEIACEYFIDKRPDVYALAGERKTLTEAEAMAAFAPS